jgi:hypothetical protein
VPSSSRGVIIANSFMSVCVNPDGAHSLPVIARCSPISQAEAEGSTAAHPETDLRSINAFTI